MSRVIDLVRGKWDLSDTETHVLLWHLLDPSQETDFNTNQVQVLSFVQHHFIFVIDLSPSVFSVAADGDYVVYDAIISSLFSVLRRLLSINSEWKENSDGQSSPREVRISVVGFSTVHTPNTRQAFLLCAPLTEESLKHLTDKLSEYVRLLVQQYEPIAKNWLIGDTEEQMLLIPGLFESDASEDDDDFGQEGASNRRNKPTLELGTSDIAMIDQMRIAHRIAQLTVGRARTVVLFVSDGVTDLPTPSVTDYFISLFRCSGIPCCFILATSPDPATERKRMGLAPSSYFAHIVNRALLETITAATNGVLCYASRQSSGSFDVGDGLIERLLYERLWCVGCHAFDSSSPQPQHIRWPYRKIPVTILVYPLVSVRFAHGFKKCRSVQPESPNDANLCLRWHPHITIRYFISQTVLEVWIEGEPGIIQSVCPLELDPDSSHTSNVDETVGRAIRSRQTVASQIEKELFRYLSRLSVIDDLLMKIYNTDRPALPADPVIHAVPIFVFIPKDRQLAVHESLRHRETGGKKSNDSEAEREMEDISAFLAYWRHVANLNIATMKLIFLTKTFQYFLNYDRPLPKVLLSASSPGVGPAPRQTSALACRLALNNIITYLKTSWASFELIENRAFVKFISDTQDLYCIVRLSDRHAPVVTLNVSFLRGTEQKFINKELQELQQQCSGSVLSSSKHTEIPATFPLSIPLDSFSVEPDAWLSNFASSSMIPEYRTLLSSIEHSLPARIRPMTNATLLSRIYRADRVVYELILPGGMAPRSLFNRVLRSFIKRKLTAGYRFSSATSNYLCFGLEFRDNQLSDETGSNNGVFLKPFAQYNISYSVEECCQPPPISADSNSLAVGAKADDQAETRPSSAVVPRRFSLAVGVSSTEILMFRIITEIWLLPVGVSSSDTSLDSLICETHQQDFYLLAKLYSYFAFRLVSIIAISQKSNFDKCCTGFTLPPTDKWYWSPPNFSEASSKLSVMDLLSHPVLTLTAHPDLFQLLSSCQEVIIRLPLLRCSTTEKSSPENSQAAKILRDLVLSSLGDRFPYRATIIGHCKSPREKGFITGENENPCSIEYTMFAMTADRPEHTTLIFIPTEADSWLGSTDTSSLNSYVCLYMYISVYDWLLNERDKRPRPADLTIDVAEDIFPVENLDDSSSEKTPPKHRRVNSTGGGMLDAGVFGADTGGDSMSGADTYLLGSVQGVKLADNLASIYVSAVYRSLSNKLPICSADFELAVSSLCTESVCSEIDLKQLLLLHGSSCPEGQICVSPGEGRFTSLISQWFQPVPCSPYYHFFKIPDPPSDDDSDSEDESFRPEVQSLSGSFDSNWLQMSAERSGNDQQARATSPSNLTSNSRTTSCAEFETEGETEENDSMSDDAMPPPPLFLHCTCSVMVKAIGDQPSSLIHIPLASLPHCLRSLLKSNSDDVDPSLALMDALNSVVSVTLDVICIAPNPLRLPTSVSSTPVHRSAPIANIANAMPQSEGAATAPGAAALRRHFRRRVSSTMVKETDGCGYYQTLSLHSSQYVAVSSLVRQLHWLVFDEMIMSVPANDLDLGQLAVHITDTLKICEMSPVDSSEDLLQRFSPLVKRKRRPLAFVFGTEQSQPIFAENLNGWHLKTAGAIVRRLANHYFFYCAIPVAGAEIDRRPPTAVTAVSSTPCENSVVELWPVPMSAISEGDLASSSRKPGSVLMAHRTVAHVLLPHLRRRHQSAAPLVPLRPPQMGQLLTRSRRLSSSRRHVETVSPPLGLAAPLFMSPQKSTGGDSLSTTTSSTRSIFTGRGYESDSELTADGHGMEEFAFTSASPVGVHTSQTCWIFCKMGAKLCKFFLYVPWLARNTEKCTVATNLLAELIDTADKCVRRTNQMLLLKEMHSTLQASRLMLHGGDEGETAMRSFHDLPSDSKLADELSLPPEHFACPVQYTHRFQLHPSLRLGAIPHQFLHQPGRANLPTAGLSDSMNASSSSTPAGRALTVFRGLLQNVAILNRRDVFTYRQIRDPPLSDLLYYLVFTSGQVNIEDRSDSESIATTSTLDIPLGSSVIHRDLSIAVSLAARPPPRLLTQESIMSNLSGSSSVSQHSQSQHWWLDMHVHGLDHPIMSELNTLITGLQHALDKAVLQNLLSALLKNPMHRLTAHDVDFIQHSQQPAHIYFRLPPIVARSNPQAWFSYFRQIFLASYAHLPHFSLASGHLPIEPSTTSRFRDNTVSPPTPLDSANTLLFFTRMESALSGIACVNISLVGPNAGESQPTPVDWIGFLGTSTPSVIVSEHLKGFKKMDTASQSDWNLLVRVWERGKVIHDLELAVERCIASAIGDMITEGVVNAVLSQRRALVASSDDISAWLHLMSFLEYVNSQLSPPAPITLKRFAIPLMRINFWLDTACRLLTPPTPSGLGSSGSGAELAALVGVQLYCSNAPDNNVIPDTTYQKQHPPLSRKYSVVSLKDARSSTNSFRKRAGRHWLVLSSGLSADWKKHAPSAPPSLAPRQSFAVIDVTPQGISSCLATALFYNVTPQRGDNIFAELEAVAKLSDFQTRCGSDIALQKAGLFSAQYISTERPSTTVYEMMNVLGGKTEIIKQVTSKTRNMPSTTAANKQEPWMLLPYGRIVFRDQIALPHRSVSAPGSPSGYITDLLLDFCRQITAAAESIHRRREAVIFAGKIVQSLENPENSENALGQLQQSVNAGRALNSGMKAQRQKMLAGKIGRRPSGHRLQAIRSSSATIATLDNAAINILRHSCRLQHFVSAPLVLSPMWRSIALARTSSIISNNSQQLQSLPQLPVEELGFYTWFKDEYIAYIQRNLWLFDLAVVSSSSSGGGSSSSSISSISSGGNQSNMPFASQGYNSQQPAPPHHQITQTQAQPLPQHTQPQFSFLSTPGGLLLFQCDLRGVDLHLRLYTWERYRASTAAAARFSELVDRCRTMTHLHSFCYDQHVRVVQAWVLDGQSVLPPSYDHAAIIRDLCTVYRRTPLYAASLICSGKSEIDGLRFMTSTELIHRLSISNLERMDDSLDLSVREFRQTPLRRRDGTPSADSSGDGVVNIPELIIAGRERQGSSQIISTTLTATLRPVVVYSDSGVPMLSDTDLEILYAVATTTKRWKELFPVETRRLKVQDILNTAGPKRRTIAPDLMAIAIALPRYTPSSNGEYLASVAAAATLRSLVLCCYRQGLAESQWKRITSAADVLSQSLQSHGSSRPDMLTCADLRALTMDVTSTNNATTLGRRNTGVSEPFGVSMGCQALPLSTVDARLARLRLSSPTPSLARALRNKFPLTVWLPAAPSHDTRPEFTLIIAQDRMCAVVIAWPSVLPSLPVPSIAAAITAAVTAAAVSTPASLSKMTTAMTSPNITTKSTSPSDFSSPSSSSLRKPFTLEAAELFFLSRHSSQAQTGLNLDPAAKPSSPTDSLPVHQSYSLYSNPSHRVFTESIIGCLAADYIRQLLDRATPGKS